MLSWSLNLVEDLARGGVPWEDGETDAGIGGETVIVEDGGDGWLVGAEAYLVVLGVVLEFGEGCLGGMELGIVGSEGEAIEVAIVGGEDYEFLGWSVSGHHVAVEATTDSDGIDLAIQDGIEAVIPKGLGKMDFIM